MLATMQQTLTGAIRQDAVSEDAFSDIQKTIMALYIAAAEMSLDDPDGARFVILLARRMEERTSDY
jgi:hypothetical protein